MSFNRNKSLTKAQKLLQKGKIQEAIVEFLEIATNDPSDLRTLLRIGDLYAKVGNIEGACDAYHKVGEQYAKDGFFLKAVAVFKQILKLDPALVRIYVRLAELYQQLGLNTEAMKQYQIVVKHYENQGLKKESLDILRKMAELDPENTASRVKLAELYSREGHKEAAIEQLRSVANDLQKKNNFQDLARVYEKMDVLGIADEATKLQLSDTYLRIADPKKALTKLEELFKLNPKNTQVLELLARTFSDLQQPEKSKSVYMELLSVFQDKGLVSEQERIQAKLRALGITASTTSNISSASAKPSSSTSPTPKATASTPGGSTKVLQEVEIFLKYGLIDKACHLLSQSVISEPQNDIYRTKLIEAYQSKNDLDGLIGILTRAIGLVKKMGDTKLLNTIQIQIDSLSAAPLSASMSAPEMSIPESSESISIPHSSNPLSSAPPVEMAGEEIALEVVEDEPVVSQPATLEANEEPLSAEIVLEPESMEVAPTAASQNEALPTFEGFNFDEEAEFEREEKVTAKTEFNFDLNQSLSGMDPVKPEEGSPKKGTAPKPKLEPTIEAPSVAEDILQIDVQEEVIDFGAPSALQSAVTDDLLSDEPPAVLQEKPKVFEKTKASPVQEKKNEKSSQKTNWNHEMEEADFFVTQGLLEEAIEMYESILAQDPHFKPAQERLKEIRSVKSPAEIEAPVAKKKEEKVVAEPSRPVSKSTERVLREEKAKQKTEEAQPAANLFDLSSELQDEIHDLEQEFQKKPKQPKDDEDYLSPEEVISEFKKGVARTVSKDDHQTHYNLGIAYKEMGLLNEAIHEFELASNSQQYSIDCASMIGLCLMSKKDFPAAVDVYRHALAKTSPQSPEALGLSYELAEAYLGNGKLNDAYKLFARVRDVDPNFRDVRRRAKELEADIGSSAPPSSAVEKKNAKKDKGAEKEDSVVQIGNKKNKISYI